MSDNQSIRTSIIHYVQEVKDTDVISLSDLQLILFGLYGEVGSIMAATKKFSRENTADDWYDKALNEEFGDALWYFAALCRRLNFDMAKIFCEAARKNKYKRSIETSDHPIDSLSDLNIPLQKLGIATSELLAVRKSNMQTNILFCKFAYCYLQALRAAKINFSTVASSNIKKVRGRFVNPELSDLPTFDDSFPEDERIPEHFEIKIMQRASGESYLQWRGVFIGDPLTDNISVGDDYRFHDVFHLANAAILHWSPVFRRLIKHKRKSDPNIDENQDGGRASVIEEGITAWIFSGAKQLAFFEGHKTLSFDLLKTVQQFVQGYEVEKCPLKLWEKAILDGYSVFREVQKNRGGTVIGSRIHRTITYEE